MVTAALPALDVGSIPIRERTSFSDLSVAAKFRVPWKIQARVLCAAWDTASCWNARDWFFVLRAAKYCAPCTMAGVHADGGDCRPPIMDPLTRIAVWSTL